MTDLNRTDWGSVPVIEAFFGEPLSPDVASLTRRLPHDQMVELADQVQLQHSRIQTTLRERSWFSGEAKGSLPPALRPPGVVVPERLYFADSVAKISLGDPGFKQLFLLADSTVLPDPTFAWAAQLLRDNDRVTGYPEPSDTWARELFRCVEYLQRLRPLLRTDAVVLIPSVDSHIADVFEDADPGALPMSDFLRDEEVHARQLWRDPYLASLAASMDIMPQWERDYLELTDDPRDLLELVERAGDDVSLAEWFPRVWNRAHPDSPISESGVLDESQRSAIGLAWLQRESGLVPAPASEVSLRHALATANLLMDGSPVEDEWLKRAALAPPLGVPDLSDVSLRDLLILRESEDDYALTRTALRTLSDVVESSSLTSFPDLDDLVAEAALDVVAPAVEQLMRKARWHSIFGTLAGAAAGLATRLSLHGIAIAAGTPIVSAASNGAGNLASRAVSDRIRKGGGANMVARSLLISTMPSDWQIRRGA